MKQGRLTYIKNILIPCLLFSVISGFFTGGLIFLFKIATSKVIAYSGVIYSFVREEPIRLPLLIIGSAILGGLSALLLHLAPNCRGGGIPTSVAILRGLIDFKWTQSVFFIFTSALMTYLCGVPLGNEGPSVQMGTAIGRGTVRLFAKKHRAWDRYIMTGGACAGFAAATGAPLTGIFFAIEEAHRRLTPMIFMVASMTVAAGSITMEILCRSSGISSSMFLFSIKEALPLQFFWVSIVIGIICGLCAILFTKIYRLFGTFMKKYLGKIPFILQMVCIFLIVALIGFFTADCIGSGHSLIDEIMEGDAVWYLLLIFLLIRAILLITANQIGVTGGLFVPTLVFGAIIGALCSNVCILLDIFPPEYRMVMIVIGMTAFLSASARTPITAVIFAVEVLCGLSNVLPIIIGVTFSYIIIETFGETSFNETVIESQVEKEHEGKIAHFVDAHLTVQNDAFVVGKDIRDILWPPTCVILSVDKNPSSGHGSMGMTAGDVLHLQYKTYDPERSKNILESLVGSQVDDRKIKMKKDKKHRQIPNF